MKALPLCLALCLGALLGGTGASGAILRPHILFVLADDLRPDCIQALGNPRIRTPHLDSLVREGYVFTRAVAAYPICRVSRAEILTGTPAFRHGASYGARVINPALATWAGTLRAAGYRTGYCGKWHNDGHPLARGYLETRGLFTAGGAPKGAPALPDHAGRKATGYAGWTFKREDGSADWEKGTGLTPDTDRHIADAAIELLGRAGKEPRFLHVNFTAPHDPRVWPRGFEGSYDPQAMMLPGNFSPQHPFDHGNLDGRDERLVPKPLREADVRAELAAYYACVSHLDAQVGRILAAVRALGRWEDTLIIFSSDQGLALGSHGLLGKQNLYEHTFRVPFVFRGPGILPGRRSEADCYLRDVFPTTCELAGVPIPATVESRSLAGLLRGGEEPVHDGVVGYFTDTQRTLRRGDWKLIRYPGAGVTQLFNLRGDPEERRNLAHEPAHREILDNLQTLLDEWLVGHGDTSLVSTGGRKADAE